jgi:hypothetical protein
VVQMERSEPVRGAQEIHPLKNLGHRVGRSTIARILQAQGLSPVPEHTVAKRSARDRTDRRQRVVGEAPTTAESARYGT